MKSLPCLAVALVMLLFGVHVVRGTEVGHWSLNEGTGTTINDTSGMGNNGTITSSAMWTSPGYEGTGWSLQFPGYSATRYVAIPNSASLNFTGALYLSAWVKPSSTYDWHTSNLLPVICKGSSSESYGLDLWGASAGDPSKGARLSFLANYLTGGTYFELQTDDTIPFDQWSHIEATYDRKTLSLYLDGQLSKQASVSYDIVNNSTPLYIGIDMPGFTEKYTGQIDEVIIRNDMIPEPLTVIGVFLGVVSLGGYARKHRPA